MTMPSVYKNKNPRPTPFFTASSETATVRHRILTGHKWKKVGYKETTRV